MKDPQNLAVRRATHAFCTALLEEILPAIRTVARFHGYAVAVHGSLSRDIDLVAIAWVEHAHPAEELVKAICGAIAGVTGNCLRQSAVTEKPHGRLAYTLIHTGFIGEIDLSVIPPCTPHEASKTSKET